MHGWTAERATETMKRRPKELTSETHP